MRNYRRACFRAHSAPSATLTNVSQRADSFEASQWLATIAWPRFHHQGRSDSRRSRSSCPRRGWPRQYNFGMIMTITFTAFSVSAFHQRALPKK